MTDKEKAALIDEFTNMLRALCHLHDKVTQAIEAGQLTPRPKPAAQPYAVGNVVALPGVDLDAARRAQRRRGRTQP